MRQNDFFDDLGQLAIGSRLKRASDYYIKEVRALYKAQGIDIEPSSMPMLLLLEKYGAMTMREIADRLGTSHPLISQRAKQLMKQGYVTSKVSQSDARSQDLELSSEGRRFMRYQKPIRDAIAHIVQDSLGDVAEELMTALSKLEEINQNLPFEKAVYQHLKTHTNEHLALIDYDPQYKDDFRRLNEEWLKKEFGEVENLADIHEKYFSDPEGSILNKGGRIFFALLDGVPVGTCALFNHDGDLELAKMGAALEMRGLGIGKRLVEHAIAEAENMNVKSLFLISDSRLAKAIRLYERLGFEHKDMTQEEYDRYGYCDAMMKYPLSKNGKDVLSG